MTDAPCAIVAIPAKDEAAHVAACLLALAAQRDQAGHRLAPGIFAVVLFVNNSRDDTAEQATALRPDLGFALHVVSADLGASDANAGGARRRAMDMAAELLEASGRRDGVLLTTDADSRVPPDWISKNLAVIDRGLDAVAGTFVLEPRDEALLPAALRERGSRESRYQNLLWEMEARLDPVAHDPWPRHGRASGASLALTLAAYRAVGGVPALALGEDRALVDILRQQGFKVRHDPTIQVVTSGRLVGRAPGGAADTMRQRIEDPNAPCDADMKPADEAFLHFFHRGRRSPAIVRRPVLRGRTRSGTTHAPLRQSDLPTQIGIATALVAMLRLLARFRPMRPALSPRLPPQPRPRPFLFKVVGRILRLAPR